MRGMQNNDTAEILLNGFKNYYNFIRPHQGLNGETPAERAGTDLDLGKNKWEGLIKKAIEHQAKGGED